MEILGFVALFVFLALLAALPLVVLLHIGQGRSDKGAGG
jgi:hypothetical protein